MKNILIYGAYGYTGRLIVQECIQRGYKPIIAGRDPEKLMVYANKMSLEYDVFETSDKTKLENWLQRGDVLIHCGGPFIYTAKDVIEGCLATGTHYLDIAGEYQVFDLAQSYNEEAKKKGVMILPGAGFDVVPSDCIAKHLHKKLPTAQDLKLAFTSKGGRLSRGTAKTMIENLGDPQIRRRDGDYEQVPMGKSTHVVNYGEFEQISMGISWGDVSTAYFSTGIPTIEVFSGTDEKQLAKVQKAMKLSIMLKSKMVKSFLLRRLEKKSDGPDKKRRDQSQMYLWGSAADGDTIVEARMKTPNGYTLTAKTATLIASKILDGAFSPGYQTPSTAYGADLVLEIEGVSYF